MQKTILPKPVWQGQDAYIIGGGPSLKDFDWSLLRGLNTIGCNDAYLLGVEVCNVCVFGDVKWYETHKKQLAQYQGTVFTSDNRMNCIDAPPWLYFLRQYAKGLHSDGIGWNGNTGAVAINLAILLGATRIYLLGFDMQRNQKDSNWHPNNLDKNNPSVYQKFLNWYHYVAIDWKEKFSDIEIINVTDDSKLEVFPKVSAKAFWAERTCHEPATV